MYFEWFCMLLTTPSPTSLGPCTHCWHSFQGRCTVRRPCNSCLPTCILPALENKSGSMCDSSQESGQSGPRCQTKTSLSPLDPYSFRVFLQCLFRGWNHKPLIEVDCPLWCARWVEFRNTYDSRVNLKNTWTVLISHLLGWHNWCKVHLIQCISMDSLLLFTLIFVCSCLAIQTLYTEYSIFTNTPIITHFYKTRHSEVHAIRVAVNYNWKRQVLPKCGYNIYGFKIEIFYLFKYGWHF